MCGILGGKSPKLSNEIRKYIADLHRRGPDNKNVIDVNSEIVFGATRLAMTDPHPRSNQPMVDEETGNVLVFNGEIYNYRKLRDELVNKGVLFKTESDTEVVLKSLTLFGISSVSRFQGMFAFAFYDNNKAELVLARDYLGKKPLYYYNHGSQFIFSSQVNTIRKILKNSALNMKAISSYLQIGYLLDPLTMYNQIYAVGPGKIMVLDSRSLALKIEKDFIPNVITSLGSSNPIDIKQALLDRTYGHSKFALSLSGGVDSTILALECVKNKLPVEVYTLAWDSDKDKYNFDSINAEKIAYELGLKCRVVLMPNGDKFQNFLTSYVQAMDEPNANPTGVSMMALYNKIAMDGHRLVLTGDGADEIFGGYPRYSKALKFDFLPELSSTIFKNIAIDKNSNKKFLTNTGISFLSSKTDEFWLFWHILSSQKKINRLLPNLQTFDIHPLGMELTEIFGEGRVASLMFRDLRTWLSMESNRKLDRISMWFSMEARSPFQSEQIVASGYHDMAIHKFKHVNKELLLDLYPEVANLPINRQKHGFISPLGHWMRTMPNLVEDSLKVLLNFLPLQTRETGRIIASAKNGNYDDMRILWRLVILGEWFNSQN
jgi:asparagine synthase (glutamine-hydrolysing)